MHSVKYKFSKYIKFIIVTYAIKATIIDCSLLLYFFKIFSIKIIQITDIIIAKNVSKITYIFILILILAAI